MHRRLVPPLILLVLALAAPAAPAEQQSAKPAKATLIVRIAAIDDLVAEARYLVEMAGREEDARQAEGFIKAKVAPRGKHAEKRIYSITDAGMAELRRWATDFMPLPAQRDPVVLKAAFFDLAPLESVREQLRAHIAQFQWRMEQWQAREEAIRDRRAELVEVWLTRQPIQEHENIIELKIHALEGLIARARAEIAWARSGLALVDQIEARRAKCRKDDAQARASG